LLDANPCLSAWSKDAERRRGLWRQFVRDEDAREREIERGDWAIGEESFRSRMAQVLGRPLPHVRTIIAAGVRYPCPFHSIKRM
jgi:hypothetical protein